ncbi:hypothetical protein CMUS01_08020 [Colletotrichum musicola]|uniref:Uncharacterized protein n=1 Tax=Colletotrichum musicola TaxID=2175873 RepID=A0A8H6KEW6_9PEZI|nr:hypothetical protein CMUS01_08020 [Colletotrichum musicola]
MEIRVRKKRRVGGSVLIVAVDGPDFVMVHGRRVPHRGRKDEEQERKEGRERSRKVLIPVPVVPPPVQVRYFALRCAQPTRRRGAVSGIPRTSRIASRASCWRGAAKTSEQVEAREADKTGRGETTRMA